jgi:hypothetical protein
MMEIKKSFKRLLFKQVVFDLKKWCLRFSCNHNLLSTWIIDISTISRQSYFIPSNVQFVIYKQNLYLHFGLTHIFSLLKMRKEICNNNSYFDHHIHHVSVMFILEFWSLSSKKDFGTQDFEYHPSIHPYSARPRFVTSSCFFRWLISIHFLRVAF